MGLRAGLDRCGKSRPTGIRSPDRPARMQSLYRLRYPEIMEVPVKYFPVFKYNLEGFYVKSLARNPATTDYSLS